MTLNANSIKCRSCGKVGMFKEFDTREMIIWRIWWYILVILVLMQGFFALLYIYYDIITKFVWISIVLVMFWIYLGNFIRYFGVFGANEANKQ